MGWSALGLVLIIPVVALALASLLSRRPDDLGPQSGRLRGCPDSSNAVSTQCPDGRHAMAPLPFRGEARDAWDGLSQLIAAHPRARVVDRSGNYLHAEFTSRVFRFVDDVEFLLDAGASQIHFRSASRTGYDDLGANRRRMESIRSAFEALNL